MPLVNWPSILPPGANVTWHPDQRESIDDADTQIVLEDTAGQQRRVPA